MIHLDEAFIIEVLKTLLTDAFVMDQTIVFSLALSFITCAMSTSPNGSK